MKWLSPLGSRNKKSSVSSVEPSPVTSPGSEGPSPSYFSRRRMSLPTVETPPSRLRGGLSLPLSAAHPHSVPPSPHQQLSEVPAIRRTACTPSPSTDDLPVARCKSSPSCPPPRRTLSPLVSTTALPTMPLGTIHSTGQAVFDDGINFDLLGPPEEGDRRAETPEPAKFIPPKAVENRRLSAAYDAYVRPKSVPGGRLGGFSADALSEGFTNFSLFGKGAYDNGATKVKKNPLKRTNTQPIVLQPQPEAEGENVLRKQKSVPSLTQLVDEEGGEGDGEQKGDIPEGTSLWRDLVARNTIKKDRSAGQLGSKKERKKSIFSWIGGSTRQPASLQRDLTVRVVAGGEPKEYKVCVGPGTTVHGVRSMLYQLHSKTSPEGATCWDLYFVDQAGSAQGPLPSTAAVLSYGAPLTFELRDAATVVRRASVWSEGEGITRKSVDISSEGDKPVLRRQSLPPKAGGQLRRSFREKISRLTSGSASNLQVHTVGFDAATQDAQDTSSGSIVDGADSSSMGEDDVWWEKRDGATAVLAVASADALVANLGMLCYTDVEFFDMFLLTYRHILSPIALLTKLAATFDEVRGGVLTAEQLRILNFVFKWIDQATFDFTAQPEMIGSLTSLQTTLSKLSYPMLQDRLSKCLVLVSGCSDVPERGPSDPTATETPPSQSVHLTHPTRSASLAMSASQDFFGVRRPDDETELSFPEMLSRGRELQCALVHCEWRHFRGVHPWALLAGLWPRQAVWPPSARQSMDRYAAWFNKVSYWVCTEVVLCSDVRQRAVMLEGFVRLGRALQRMGAYNTAYAVCTGLNHGAVQRLKRSWELVPSEGLRRMAELEELFSPMQNFANYRQCLALDQRTGVGVVPVTSVVLKDLTGVNEIPRTLDNGYINVHKLRLVANIVKEFRLQQECNGPPPDCDSETCALRYVLSLPVLAEKAAYHLSYIHEPRDGALTLRAKLQLIKDWAPHHNPPPSPNGRALH